MTYQSLREKALLAAQVTAKETKKKTEL